MRAIAFGFQLALLVVSRNWQGFIISAFAVSSLL
jgi:hypothetical protein